MSACGRVGGRVRLLLACLPACLHSRVGTHCTSRVCATRSTRTLPPRHVEWCAESTFHTPHTLPSLPTLPTLQQVVGWFYVGVSDRMHFYKGRRGPIADKVKWIE